MSAPRYATQCLHGTSFRSYTYDEPETRAEIIRHFKGLWDGEYNDPIPKSGLSLRSISKIWDVGFVHIK